MIIKRIVLVAVFLPLLSLVASHVFAADNLELGIPLPLTGGQAKFGAIEKKSYEIAAEEINAKGGVGGKKIILSGYC